MTTDHQKLEPGLPRKTNTSFRRTMRRFSLAALMTVAVLLFTQVAVAEKHGTDQKEAKADYALIFGTLWSADNRPVQGATIKIRRSDQKKPKWTLVSDRRGEFAQRVPPGRADYVVWAEVPNKRGHAAETTVHIDNNERTDIGLHLAE